MGGAKQQEAHTSQADKPAAQQLLLVQAITCLLSAALQLSGSHQQHFMDFMANNILPETLEDALVNNGTYRAATAICGHHISCTALAHLSRLACERLHIRHLQRCFSMTPWNRDLLAKGGQELTGVVLTGMVEDPEGATIRKLAAEAAAALAGPGATAPEAAAGPTERGQSSLWIAPAPALVKLRLFCLPYAGGVSENVFAR